MKKRSAVVIVMLLAFVPAVLAMLPIKGLRSGVPWSAGYPHVVEVPGK